MLPEDTLAEAAALLDLLRARGWRLATAESCTGGLIAAALTAIAGSSAVVTHGFVTYSNEAKRDLLGVPMGVIEGYGAVSDSVARRMAEGALARSGAEVAVSCTGIAGPGGATPGKPVGLVHLGVATAAGTRAVRRVFPGDRMAVRAATVLEAFALARAAAG
ncbi:CinA family protein [Paracraurococcus ruber]|uniref:Damage-inducible protein CinA n=1 Tax=Paracraurococcus ruber TaxID=77675 RepID=A0ABS1D3R6_9PROT|nr:CinA family protein [Paracraurococcus ruber]MBK1661090.1 damage-inducible protein CinA [Paracraurococcus ruber]TDG09721.1 CinA family protein [Paracraurococcus ruber]